MDIIEIARELATEQIVPELEQTYYTFTVLDLKLFTQRIEQPLQLKINELNFDIAHQQRQIEQLREALKEAAFIAKTFVDGYEDLANSVGVFETEKASIKTARKQLKMLEKTT